MIFTLYLGGYLKPHSVHRISEFREYVVYNGLCRQNNSDVYRTNINLLVQSLGVSSSGNAVKQKLKAINKNLDALRALYMHDVDALKNTLRNEAPPPNGLTGDPDIDSMINLFKLLESKGIIK